MPRHWPPRRSWRRRYFGAARMMQGMALPPLTLGGTGNADHHA